MANIDNIALKIQTARRTFDPGNDLILNVRVAGTRDPSDLDKLTRAIPVEPSQQEKLGMARVTNPHAKLNHSKSGYLTFYVDVAQGKVFYNGKEITAISEPKTAIQKAWEAHNDAQDKYRNSPRQYLSSDIHKGEIGRIESGMRNPSLVYLGALQQAEIEAAEAKP